MRKGILSTLALGLGLIANAQATLELPRHADLDLSAARQLADSALALCDAAVTVLDRGGNALLMLRVAHVGVHYMPASQRKAYTALSTKTSTITLAASARSTPDSANLNTFDALLLLGGGIPLYASQQLVGAIGIAGAGGAQQDDACAIAAANSMGLGTTAYISTNHGEP
jgi:uncharacterized protein GlcG (DUF336 family)